MPGDSAPAAPRVLVAKLHPQARLPEYPHPGDAGAELRAVTPQRIAPSGVATISTGLAMALPAGFAGLIISAVADDSAQRPGSALPAVLDAGYRGEIVVHVLNRSATDAALIEPGELLARLVIQPISQAQFLAAERLPGAARTA